MTDLIKTTNNLMTDRLQLKDDVEFNLLEFVNLQIQKVNNESSLKKSVLEKISERLNDDEEPVNDLVLLKLLEILAKQDNEIALGIMDLLKNNKSVDKTPEDYNGLPPVDTQDSQLTKENVNEVKELLKTLEQIKKSEF